MKLRKITAVILLVIILFSAASCNSKKTGVNILEQNEDYVGEFDMPSIKKLTPGTALWVLASFKDNGYKIKSAVKTNSDDQTLVESYKINMYDVYVELFRYTEDSPKLAQITETGKYTIYGNTGNVVQEYTAYVNGTFVLFFSASIDFTGEDKSAENQKVADIFKSLDISANTAE